MCVEINVVQHRFGADCAIEEEYDRDLDELDTGHQSLMKTFGHQDNVFQGLLN